MSAAPNHGERAHAILSPSKAHRWSRCPGSALAEAGIPDTPPGPESQWGTACHELGELSFQLGTAATAVYFQTWKASNGVGWTQEMGETAEVYRQYLINSKPLSAVWQIEGKKAFPAIHPECSGTADAMVIIPFERAHVVDLKGGQGVTVDAVDNDQLLVYASPALEADVETIEMTIVQPRTREGAPIKTWVIDRATLAKEVKRISDAAHLAMTPNAPRAAGDHCKWCRAAKNCPALRKTVMETAQMEFTDIPDETGALLSVPPKPSDLSPQQIANILRFLPLIETWSAAVYADAFARAKRNELPGFKLVEGRAGNRAWRDKEQAAAALEMVGADPFEKVLISPAAAEKALVAAIKASDGGTKKDAEMKAKRILDDVVHRASGRPAVVPETDPRPALSLSAADDFTEIPAE